MEDQLKMLKEEKRGTLNDISKNHNELEQLLIQLNRKK